MNEIIYLNGKFVSRDDASISPNDRGFLFADGIYEVIKYYNGKPFMYSDHVKRLIRSLNEIQIRFDDVSIFEDVFMKLIEKNNLAHVDAGIYLQITRGPHKRVHYFPAGTDPTVYAYAFPFPSFKVNLENGISAITREDIRWLRCDIKSVSLLPNTMLYNQAVEGGAGECILIRDGKVTEATHSSLLAVFNGIVVTHPLTNLLLPGITRKVILDICAEHSMPVEERAISEKELYEADEVMIAGTGSEITPVIVIDGKPIGNKKPGKITRFLQQIFFELT